jgi:TPR repeat protein
VLQRSGNDNILTARLPNPADVQQQQDQSPTAFDPLVLQQFHEIGVQPDLAQARDWYERAARLGSDGASQRLAKIAPPPQ